MKGRLGKDAFWDCSAEYGVGVVNGWVGELWIWGWGVVK